jgi:wobble nucleotide-excising tRNase
MALKYACLIKCNQHNAGSPRPKVNIIIPSCLRVDKAIIFFISSSIKAAKPAITVVIAPTHMTHLIQELKTKLNRTRR